MPGRVAASGGDGVTQRAELPMSCLRPSTSCSYSRIVLLPCCDSATRSQTVRSRGDEEAMSRTQIEIRLQLVSSCSS